MKTDEQMLSEILDRMDVPEQRKKDWGWLNRNLGIRNSDHPEFNEAKMMLKKIMCLSSFHALDSL